MYLSPIRKGWQPFNNWAIDCITKLPVPASNGGRDVVIAVDAWSKWVEYRVLNPLDSRETARFLYENIICRYSIPSYVRTDSSTEFAGDFRTLCDQYGIQQRVISTINPRPNVKVERYNLEIKAGLCRLIA